MPTMNEIYNMHADQYDELVSHEDYQHNLANWIDDNIQTDKISAYEFGAGTGRLTKLYASKARNVVAFDRSPHMLERCKQNLVDYGNISYEIRDNTDFDNLGPGADLVIEGWSFGHTIVENASSMESVIDRLVRGCLGLLRNNGMVVIIETMGSNCDEPRIPGEILRAFYAALEDKYCFKKTILRTDYRFDSWEEGYRVFDFFFGHDQSKTIKELKMNTIKEHTGIWYRNK